EKFSERRELGRDKARKASTVAIRTRRTAFADGARPRVKRHHAVAARARAHRSPGSAAQSPGLSRSAGVEVKVQFTARHVQAEASMGSEWISVGGNGNAAIVKWSQVDPGFTFEGRYGGLQEGKFGSLAALETARGPLLLPVTTALASKIARVRVGGNVQ